jgi:UTP--glucose-1-phosphate uridylyltransferase
MRPATHAVPKALIPIVDRPAVHYVVEEAARAGATTIVLVVDPDGRHLIEQHFVDASLAAAGDAQIETVVQEDPLGLGDAILRSCETIAGRPFMCLLADTIVRPGGDIFGPLLDAFETERSTVIALNEVDDAGTERYGIAAVRERLGANLIRLAGTVEKPGPEEAPSRLALIGRYVFTPEVFDVLDGLEPGHGGEIQLTDAIDVLARSGRCRGVVVDDLLLDTGRPIGVLEASTVLGLADPGLRQPYVDIIERERRRLDV